ncbi:TetR family transcriptional regulator [Promicromonospora iranensis]|uniref:TetR family transcriptional regulator n=1 Tax=Promicromonospora iranensis TaxID=1105144 RepID=UPI0023A97C2C|nr:TetR family transcriptional regulator [Promicromonospora iranensis]
MSGSPRHSRDDVSEMALRLLDEYGLPDLTMRHIAAALEVRASALYWHFPNKQALLASVSARILAPMEHVRVEDMTVSEAVRRLGARLRECLLAYRDAAELVSSSLALGLVDSPVRPQLMAVTRRDGVPDSLSRVAAEAVMHFVVGYTFHEQQRLTADSFGLLPEAASSLNPDNASARPADGGDFEEALKMIADGLEVSARQHTETSAG